MNWGTWLLGISVVHFIYAGVQFHKQYMTILRSPFNAVDGSPDQLLHTGAWFFMFGVLMVTCGLAVSALEKAGTTPKSVGWSLLALTILGVIPMPKSGFWLALPPAIGILMQDAKAKPS